MRISDWSSDVCSSDLLIRVDLPEPETPVIAVNSPEEIVRSTSLRLLPDAPSSLSCIFRLGLWRCFGTSICRFQLRYWPVSERGASSPLAELPSATTPPPCPPAPRSEARRLGKECGR